MGKFQVFKVLLKFLFALAIIIWLLKSEKLDFSLISQSFSNGYTWLICIVLIIIQDIVAAFRWKILLRVKSSEQLPFSQVIKVTWIGLFFNSVLPGAVTGDIIKLLYARDLDKKLDKTFLITSAVMDRVLGLIGLLFILGLFSSLYYSEIIAMGPKMETILHFNFFLFFGVLFFLIILFLPRKKTLKVVYLFSKLPLIGKKTSKTLAQIWLIGENKKQVFICLALSIVCQFLNVFAFWSITAPFYDKALAFHQLFTFIPLGQMAIAVPISPAGLGVGHVIFQTLFSYIGISNGASLFNLFFLALVFVNLLGFFPYILSGKKHGVNEAKDFDDEVN